MRVLQLPCWEVNYTIEKLDLIKDCGFDAIQIVSVNPCKEELGLFGHYQIYDLVIGNYLYTEESLKQLCDEAHKRGLKVIIDSIFTHFANKSVHNSLEPNEKVAKRFTENPWFWKDKQQINYNDRNSVINHCNGLAATRTDNWDFEDIVIDYIDYLTEDIGADGLRLDSMKMIGLPEENGNMFLTRVFENIVKNDLIVYGEIIYEKKELLKKYQKYVNVLVNLSADAYDIDRNKEFVFFESHDSYHTGSGIGWSYRLNDDNIISNYYYLCQDFPNTVFYCRNLEILKRCKSIHEKFN